MLRKLRERLTYANVVATLALFVALGGSSYAALTITGRNVKNSSLTYRDLKRNTLGGTRIKESRLGKVPRARNADRVGGVSASRLVLSCPAGTTFVADVCVETTPRAPTVFGGASGQCNATGGLGRERRLPTYDELVGYARTASNTFQSATGEFTSLVIPSSADPSIPAAIVLNTPGGLISQAPDTAAFPRPYRCVLDPRN